MIQDIVTKLVNKVDKCDFKVHIQITVLTKTVFPI